MTYEQTYLFFTIVENTSVLIHGKKSPSDEAWSDYIQAIKAYPFTAAPRVLVFSDGGGPTPAQRQSLSKLTGGAPYFCSIIAEAANIRFISAALALANPNVKSFSPAEFNEALSYLQLSAPQIDKIKQKLLSVTTQIKNDVLARATNLR